MFTQLPSCVLSDLLSRWLPIRFVARLDSACCNKSVRHAYLQLCQRNEFAFDDHIYVSSRSVVLWLLLRRFHVTSVVLIYDADIIYFAQLLPITGKQLRFVNVTRMQTDCTLIAINSLLARYCPTIANLHVKESNVEKSAFASLTASSSLESIRLNTCSLTDNALVSHPMHSIKDVSLSVIRVGHAHNFLAMFPNLLTLELDCLFLTDEQMIQITVSCPRVKECLLLHCKPLTENGLKVAIQRWTLQAITVRGSGIHTDGLLDCISTDCTTLESFLFTSANSFTACAVERLICKCPRLTAVALGWHPMSPQEFVDVIAPRLGNIKVLALAQPLCCDTVLCAVSQYCKCLEILDLKEDKLGHCTSTGTGLICVINKCSRLRRLAMNPAVRTAHFSFSLVLNMMHSIGPNLQINCDATMSLLHV